MSEVIKVTEKIKYVDLNVKAVWDSLDEVQQKALKGEFFILNRWVSSTSASASREEQEHYVLTTNEYYNKNWYLLQKHPKLLWLLLCLTNYNGEKIFFHEWIAHKKTANTDNKKIKFILEIYPTMKISDIEMLATLTTNKELKELAKEHGMDDATFNRKMK